MKTLQLGIRLDERIRKRLEKAAAELGVTVTEYARIAITEKLDATPIPYEQLKQILDAIAGTIEPESEWFADI